MVRARRTRTEKLRDKQAQLERMVDNNIAWEYVNKRLKMQNKSLRCKLEYLEKMEQEIVENPEYKKGPGVSKIL